MVNISFCGLTYHCRDMLFNNSDRYPLRAPAADVDYEHRLADYSALCRAYCTVGLLAGWESFLIWP
jgi:hypothetical protein